MPMSEWGRLAGPASSCRRENFLRTIACPTIDQVLFSGPAYLARHRRRERAVSHL